MTYFNLDPLVRNFIENAIKWYNLPVYVIENTFSHFWIQDPKYGSMGDNLFCKKCNANIYQVLLKEFSKNIKWAELTCNELIIKKLLE